MTCRDSPFHTVTPWGRAPVAPSSQFWGRGSRGVVWTPRGWRETGLQIQGGAPTEAGMPGAEAGELCPWSWASPQPHTRPSLEHSRCNEAAPSGKSGSGPHGSPSPWAL